MKIATPLLWLTSTAIALAAGIQSFLVVWFAPVAHYGTDKVMLAWGWVASIIGLPVATLVVGIVHKKTYSLFKRALASASNRSRNVAVAVAGTLACVVLTGWFMWTYGDVHVQWSEQVDLDHGKSIVISRSVKGNVFGNNDIRAENWHPTEYTIDLPRSSGTTTPPVWRSPLRPVLLELDPTSNTWYLIAEPFGCSVWVEFGGPTPPYFQYTLVRNAWVQGKFDPKHIGRRPNLLLSPRFAGEEHFVSSEASRNRNDDVPEGSRPIIRAENSSCY